MEHDCQLSEAERAAIKADCDVLGIVPWWELPPLRFSALMEPALAEARRWLRQMPLPEQSSGDDLAARLDRGRVPPPVLPPRYAVEVVGPPSELVGVVDALARFEAVRRGG